MAPETARPSEQAGRTRAAATVAAVDGVRRVVRALRLGAREVEREAGVSAAQLFVLEQLVDGEQASLTDLAERTLTDRSSVAAVVERLAARRLVTRGTSTEDRRRAAVKITAAGSALLRRAPRAPTALLIDALDRCGDEELASVAGALTLLARQLGVSAEHPAMLFEEEDGPGAEPARARRSRAGRGRAPSGKVKSG